MVMMLKPIDGIGENDGWNGAKQMMNNPAKFVDELKKFSNKIGNVSGKTIDRIRNIDTKEAETVKRIKEVSSAADNIYQWLKNTLNLLHIKAMIAPVLHALRCQRLWIRRDERDALGPQALEGLDHGETRCGDGQLQALTQTRNDALLSIATCQVGAARASNAQHLNGGIAKLGRMLVQVFKIIHEPPFNAGLGTGHSGIQGRMPLGQQGPKLGLHRGVGLWGQHPHQAM